MAIRVRAQLRKWFGRGMYPTAEQFSDLFDSFFHKTEDKIPMSGVEGLTDQLNGKYNTAEGRELEKKVQKVTDDLSVHVASSEKAFNEVQNDIEALDGRLDDEIERAKDEEAAIRRELAAGDAATLSSAKSYTDTSVAAEAEERTQGDATTLSSAKTYTDTSVADEAQKRGQGDAATLQSANSHADAAVASEKSARESGDRTTLESAKAYVDNAIAELVDGSPAALDTLKELSAALGNDPRLAAMLTAATDADDAATAAKLAAILEEPPRGASSDLGAAFARQQPNWQQRARQLLKRLGSRDGQPDAQRLPARQFGQQRHGAGAVVGAGAFDQRDGAGKRAAVALRQGLGQLVHGVPRVARWSAGADCPRTPVDICTWKTCKRRAVAMPGRRD